MNHARVMAYCDSQGRVVDVPSLRNHVERAKVIIDDARYGEHRPIVDMDVVVHFARNDFDGLSFGLALTLADKRDRYGIAGHTGRIVAARTRRPLGQVAEIEGFNVKLACVEPELMPGDLFVFIPRTTSPGPIHWCWRLCNGSSTAGLSCGPWSISGSYARSGASGIVVPSYDAPEGGAPHRRSRHDI